jgi:hypothetical protein
VEEAEPHAGSYSWLDRLCSRSRSISSILRTDRPGCQADEVNDITVTEYRRTDIDRVASGEWPNEGLSVYFSPGPEGGRED